MGGDDAAANRDRASRPERAPESTGGTRIRNKMGLVPLKYTPVSCHNGWDPLEEVIVGRMDSGCFPPWDEAVRASMPKHHWELFKAKGGSLFSNEEIDAANANLDALAGLLSQAGVIVRRPDKVDHTRAFRTPHWQSPSGMYSAMPRDIALVVGNTMIEAAMSWRSRYHEIEGFRPLFLEYFNAGASWICPPKPLLKDSLYAPGLGEEGDGTFRSVLNETEIIFDAADFLVCGRDILYFRSHTTNRLGVEWLERTLGEGYRFLELDCDDDKRMHIDTTFLPIGPGKMLVNPDRVKANHKPHELRNWDFLPAPRPCSPEHATLYMSSSWLSMNILMINETTAVVAAHEATLIRALKEWGIEAIPCPFLDFYRFGGSVHCATLDVRRTGDLRSYL
jgi:glycine amidinotransferase